MKEQRVRLIKDLIISQFGIIKKGTILLLKDKNKRFAYLNIYGNTLKCSPNDIEEIKE